MSIIRSLELYRDRRRAEAIVAKTFDKNHHEANRAVFARIVQVSKDYDGDTTKISLFCLLGASVIFYLLAEGGMMAIYNVLDHFGVLKAVDDFLNIVTGVK